MPPNRPNIAQTGNYTVRSGDKYNPFTGEALGANQGTGSTLYASNDYAQNYLSQTDPQSLQNFQQANPGLQFTSQDYGNYLNAGKLPNTISNQNLTSAQPYNLPITTYPTTASGLSGFIDSTYQASLQANQPQIDKEKTTKDYIERLLGDSYGKLATKPQETERIYSEQGVDTKKQALDDTNNQIMAERNALNHQRNSIFNAPGVTREQAQQQYSEVERQSLSKQADLAIIQSAASQNYANAQSIADRKIQMEFEGYQQELDARKFFYQEHKDEYNKLEQRQYEAGIKRDETKLSLALDQAKTLQNTKLSVLKDAQENGAPVGILTKIQQAENPEAAMAAAGNYLGLYNRLNIASEIRQRDGVGGNGINSDSGKANISADAEDILAGRNTLYNIRLQMGRTKDAAAYMLALRNEIRKADSKFDFVSSDAGGKFVSSEYFQKSVASINSVLPNIDKAVELSDQVNRLGLKSVDNLLQKGSIQIGDQKVANFRQAQKLIADEIGLALGNGTVSDMKLQLGFDVTDPSVSPEVFASNMALVKEFIVNRKTALSGQRYQSSTVQGNSGTTVMTGPQGTFNVPNDQVDLFKQNGYK